MNEQIGNQTGNVAPNFALKDGDGTTWTLENHRGNVVVLLFYPGDNTPICTKQMCSVRDNWGDYQKTGAEVVGISTDSVASHTKFADKHDLPLKLLSDERGAVTKLFDVKSWMPNRSARAVFVIDKSGVIRYRQVQSLSIFRPQDDDILRAIKQAG